MNSLRHVATRVIHARERDSSKAVQHEHFSQAVARFVTLQAAPETRHKQRQKTCSQLPIPSLILPADVLCQREKLPFGLKNPIVRFAG